MIFIFFELDISFLFNNYFKIIVLNIIKFLIGIKMCVFIISININLILDSVFFSQDVINPFFFNLGGGDLICLSFIK